MKERPETTTNAADEAEQQFYTTAKVASIFGVTTETVRNWIASGRLPAVRIASGHYRVRRADLIEFGGSTYDATNPASESQAAFL